MTEAITNGMYTSWGGNSAAPTAEQQTLGHDAFLKLLVAQLKYQDPSSPTDATQFMAQTAQLSTVEKIEQLATLNQQVLDAAQTQSALAMVGHHVSYTTDTGDTAEGTVSGVSILGGVPNVEIGDAKVSVPAVTHVDPLAR